MFLPFQHLTLRVLLPLCCCARWRDLSDNLWQKCNMFCRIYWSPSAARQNGWASFFFFADVSRWDKDLEGGNTLPFGNLWQTHFCWRSADPVHFPFPPLVVSPGAASTAPSYWPTRRWTSLALSPRWRRHWATRRSRGSLLLVWSWAWWPWAASTFWPRQSFRRNGI